MEELDTIKNIKLSFDDKNECKIVRDNIKKDISDGPVYIIDTKDKLNNIIFPRVKKFHKIKNKNKIKINSDNIFKDDINKLFSNKYLNIYNSNENSTIDTLNYMFDEFHTSIFVQIINNKISTFVLLKNYNMNKDIIKNIKTNPNKYKNINQLIDTIHNKYFKDLKIIKNQEDSIYFTDCYINLWSIPNIQMPAWWLYIYQYDMINKLLKTKQINDIEFILNFKDQNILTKEININPHYHLLGNLTTPLKKKYSSFIPILNIGAHNKFADLPIPTNDDWEICNNKIYLGACRDLYFNVKKDININYDSKIPTAIFRGSSTGCGTTIKNNPRLKAAYLSKKYVLHPKYGMNNNQDGKLYLDARITKFTNKVKKHYSDEYIDFINPDELRLRPTKRMTINAISNYKYILSIEGNIAAFRLTLELAYNSVILLVQSPYYIWYQPLLKPWVHYVPVKNDLSDLMDKIDWCKKNDNKCKEIANNSYTFYKKYINNKSIYDYLEILFNN